MTRIEDLTINLSATTTHASVCRLAELRTAIVARDAGNRCDVEPFFSVRWRKIGGIRFLRFGRLNVQFSIAKRALHS